MHNIPKNDVSFGILKFSCALYSSIKIVAISKCTNHVSLIDFRFFVVPNPWPWPGIMQAYLHYGMESTMYVGCVFVPLVSGASSYKPSTRLKTEDCDRRTEQLNHLSTEMVKKGP